MWTVQGNRNVKENVKIRESWFYTYRNGWGRNMQRLLNPDLKLFPGK
jgi:hypothetical protein